MKDTLLVLIAGWSLAALGAAFGTPTHLSAQDDPAQAQNDDKNGFAGHWLGAIQAPGTQLRLLFHITGTETDNGLSAVMFSVDQGYAAVPVDTVVVTTGTDFAEAPLEPSDMAGAVVRMSMPLVGASFAGSLSADGNQIEGTFAQAGVELPLALERLSQEEAEAHRTRPQDPAEPLPYHAEEVAYLNPEGGHTLAGTFTRPNGDGAFPAVILISGSGPQDRNESLMGHRPFLVLSDHLTRNGIAVLRFDDRGVGGSTGDFASATSADFATDVIAGVEYLMTRSDVDGARIGLAGHSEGGLIAPIAAVQSQNVSYIVLMAAPGMNGEEILYAQGELIARAAGADSAAVAKGRTEQAVVFGILKEEDDLERAAVRIEEFLREQFLEASEEERAQAGVVDDVTLEAAIAGQLASVNTRWFRYFLVHEPGEVLERVTVPVLAINGEKDLQVPYEENLAAIEAALQRGGNTFYEVRALPGHNHLFQHANTGAPSEYATIGETWSVESMELITRWIVQTVGRERVP